MARFYRGCGCGCGISHHKDELIQAPAGMKCRPGYRVWIGCVEVWRDAHPDKAAALAMAAVVTSAA